MPAMLAQLAGAGHRYESQLGWGTTLKAHWGDAPIAGFDDRERASALSAPPPRRPTSGDYDAVVLTEMVEIRDAIRYLRQRRLPRTAGPAGPGTPTRTRGSTSTRPGTGSTTRRAGSQRLDRDLGRYWEGEILRRGAGRRRHATGRST